MPRAIALDDQAHLSGFMDEDEDENDDGDDFMLPPDSGMETDSMTGGSDVKEQSPESLSGVDEEEKEDRGGLDFTSGDITAERLLKKGDGGRTKHKNGLFPSGPWTKAARLMHSGKIGCAAQLKEKYGRAHNPRGYYYLALARAT